jgi:hypothetical protein
MRIRLREDPGGPVELHDGGGVEMELVTVWCGMVLGARKSYPEHLKSTRVVIEFDGGGGMGCGWL